MSDTLPNMRKDPISNEWVIFAPEKTHTVIRNSKESDALLPLDSFSPGFEYTTGSTLFSVEGKHTPTTDWSVRVFPAQHPLLHVEEPHKIFGDGLYDVMARIGAHEVIVETAREVEHLDELTPEEIVNIFTAYRARMHDLKGDKRIKTVMILKNRGTAAGGMLSEHYSELLAFPFIPPVVKSEIENSNEYYDFKNRCVFCDLIHQEESFKKRVVAENGDFIAITPYASRFPFEVSIMPKQHYAHFTNQPESTMLSLALLYKKILFAIRTLLDSPAWNAIIHTSPINTNEKQLHDSYHWHMSIFPRISSITSMTFGAGVFVNPVLPEEAATALRKAIREAQ
ncbi:hypothetical protein KAH37_00260 [bacterium]|nr:hypothetical protein [bacterium]